MVHAAVKPRSANYSSENYGGCFRWPIFLWLAQLAVPLPILAYGLLRILKGPPPEKLMWTAISISAVWVAAATTAVLLGRVRRWFVSKRHQLALCFVSVLLTAAVCDLALTVTGLVPSISAQRARSLEYRPSVSTRHRLVPKVVAIEDQAKLRINSRGFLGPEIAMPKPKGTTRLLFLGGSHVFGAFWSGGEDWPAMVGKTLSQNGHHVDVINAGVPSHQTGDSLGKLVTDLWLTEPDIIVVCGAWNDIKYFSELTPELPYRDVAVPSSGRDPRIHPQGLDRLLCLSALYRIGHEQLVTMLKGVGDEGEKLKEPTGTVSDFAVRQYRLNLQTICDVGRNIGAVVVLCKQARLPVADSSESDRRRIPYEYTGLAHDELIRAFAECDRVIAEVAAEKHCPVIDMHAPLSGKADRFADHIHFSREGSRQAARLVAEQIEPLVEVP